MTFPNYEHRAAPKVTVPGAPFTEHLRVLVRHPGYPHAQPLLGFQAFDGGADGGLHAGTVLLACGIIACNAFDGYLTTDAEGRQQLQPQHDDLLLPGEYFFHVPYPYPTNATDSPFKYPVCPSFSHWQFPHNNLPPQWFGADSHSIIQGNPSTAGRVQPTQPLSTISSAVRARDGNCLVSGSGDMLDRAHLCPRAENAWFKANYMMRYNGDSNTDIFGEASTDDALNAITLRPDIHKAFDRKIFVIAKKKGSWVCHFLTRTWDLGRMFHNVELQMPAIAPQFLLVRFAWAIFPHIRPFLVVGGSVLIRQRIFQKDGTVQETEKEVSATSIAGIIGLSAKVSGTPRKRKRGDDPADSTLFDGSSELLEDDAPPTPSGISTRTLQSLQGTPRLASEADFDDVEETFSPSGESELQEQRLKIALADLDRDTQVLLH